MLNWSDYLLDEECFSTINACAQPRFQFYYIHLEITGDPCNLIGSKQSAIYSQIALFFALNRTISPANEKETQKLNNQSDFKTIFNLICSAREDPLLI